jgi:hypothetical protein
MPVVLTCNCGKQNTVSEGAAGTSIGCAECGRAIKVPTFKEMRRLIDAGEVIEVLSAAEPLPFRRTATVASALIIGVGGWFS